MVGDGVVGGVQVGDVQAGPVQAGPVQAGPIQAGAVQGSGGLRRGGWFGGEWRVVLLVEGGGELHASADAAGGEDQRVGPQLPPELGHRIGHAGGPIEFEAHEGVLSEVCCQDVT